MAAMRHILLALAIAAMPMWAACPTVAKAKSACLKRAACHCCDPDACRCRPNEPADQPLPASAAPDRQTVPQVALELHAVTVETVGPEAEGVLPQVSNPRFDPHFSDPLYLRVEHVLI